MGLLCKIFGHKHMPPGWWGDIPYVKVQGGGVDGIGRIHGSVHHECDRCGETYMAGRIHFTNSKIVDALKANELLSDRRFQSRVHPWLMACFGAEIAGPVSLKPSP